MTVRLTVSSTSSALAIRSRVGRLGEMRPPSSRAIGGVVPTPPIVGLRCHQSAHRAHVRHARQDLSRERDQAHLDPTQVAEQTVPYFRIGLHMAFL